MHQLGPAARAPSGKGKTGHATSLKPEQHGTDTVKRPNAHASTAVHRDRENTINVDRSLFVSRGPQASGNPWAKRKAEIGALGPERPNRNNTYCCVPARSWFFRGQKYPRVLCYKQRHAQEASLFDCDRHCGSRGQHQKGENARFVETRVRYTAV